MDRFDAMRIFTRIVELRSFTQAAHDLGYPKATVTHAIKQLEARLRVRLLQRTTRQVTPTPDGEAYYQRCVRLLADLEETEAVFSSAAQQPAGKLRIDLHATLAMHFVMPVLDQFCARYPLIELEIGMGDRLVDLVREGVDCVLRVGELGDSSMVARRVALLEQLTCASPAYLAAHGTPESLAQLDGHRAVNFFSAQTGKVWPFDFKADGQRHSVALPGTVSVNSADAYHACCRAGMGLIQAPRYHLERALAAGDLVEVLRDLRPDPLPVSVLYPHHRQLSPRVRVFADWVASLFDGVH
ncbi:LysR family transcriptional regulator [Janthinobacterium sp. BJB301]|uniref:LysR family transcriptional regulator n=1 Tax=Janthinobacterium sp. BJB301 TaxID=1560195 RepID=UPI000C0EB76F|nr:LysR family transcriptional regulator [Janthinobacterium sp. BJB301]PHV51623.1 LysR family transcriptional regulator [Janthinobacterium sp. BJB301]